MEPSPIGAYISHFKTSFLISHLFLISTELFGRRVCPYYIGPVVHTCVCIAIGPLMGGGVRF